MGSFVSIPGFSREQCCRLRGFESLEQGNVGSICSAIRDKEVVHMLVTWSILAFLISALCWIAGDALIVGLRKPDRREHGEFIELMGDDAYAFYTRINEPRLRWGALVANYAIPLMLAGLYAHWVLLRGSAIGVAGVVLLGSGFCLSPRWPWHPNARTSPTAQPGMARNRTGRSWNTHAGSIVSSWPPGSPPSG